MYQAFAQGVKQFLAILMVSDNSPPFQKTPIPSGKGVFTYVKHLISQNGLHFAGIGTLL